MLMILSSTSRGYMKKQIWQDRLSLKSSRRYSKSKRGWTKVKSHSQKNQLFKIRKMKQLIIEKGFRLSILIPSLITIKQSKKQIQSYMLLLSNINSLKRPFTSLILCRSRFWRWEGTKIKGRIGVIDLSFIFAKSFYCMNIDILWKPFKNLSI